MAIMADLTNERLGELREKAERATSGEWFHAGLTAIESRHTCSPTHLCRGIADTSRTSRAEDEERHRPQAMADAAHIATFDPPTVLALLDEVARLRGVVERVEALAYSRESEKFRHAATHHIVRQPYADNRYVRLLDDIRAAIDGTEKGGA